MGLLALSCGIEILFSRNASTTASANLEYTLMNKYIEENGGAKHSNHHNSQGQCKTHTILKTELKYFIVLKTTSTLTISSTKVYHTQPTHSIALN